MKFTVQSIVSLPIDGASSHLLTFNSSIRVLLDCGLPRNLDFNKYLEKRNQLKQVCLVLVSHSQLEYSGALAFLVDEIGMDPNIFYTTQPIMRYSPLNIHEQLLNIRSKCYTKKIFNKIYKIYQSINIIKPLQKKCITVNSQSQRIPQSQSNLQAPTPNPSTMQDQQEQPLIGDAEDQIFFTCFCAGSHMGSLAWRLSFGIVNVLYMVDYNNFSLYHINGLNLQQIMGPIDIFVTDTYRNIDQSFLRKTYFYQKIKDILASFYARNGLSFDKPPVAINPDTDRKIVFSCYPNELLVEVMAVVKKVIEDVQSPQSREKVRVVHLSSRFLQLIKSQMDYFSPYFRDTLQNNQHFFQPSKQLSGRINLTTLSTLQGLLCNSINSKPVQIYYFGPKQKPEQLLTIRQQGDLNIGNFKIMINDDRGVHSASKIDVEDPDGEPGKMMDVRADGRGQNSQFSQEKEQTISDVPDEVELIQDVGQPVHQPLHSKYFSQVGFPRFTSKLREEQQIYDDYGRRHQYARFNAVRTIDDYKRQVQLGLIQPQIKKKNSTIQIMNIQFRIPQNPTTLDFSKIRFQQFYSNRTNFNSSVQLITALKPDNVILINSQANRRENFTESLSNKYQLHFKNLPNHGSGFVGPIPKIYDLAPKNYRVLELENQLISYKVNYIPIPQERKLQKVKGLIRYSSNGTLYIHLDCLQEKQHLEFRLDKFYKRLKQQSVVDCVWTTSGLLIDGVRLYRDDKKIVLEGEYSEQYFRVRKMLYEFLALD